MLGLHEIIVSTSPFPSLRDYPVLSESAPLTVDAPEDMQKKIPHIFILKSGQNYFASLGGAEPGRSSVEIEGLNLEPPAGLAYGNFEYLQMLPIEAIESVESAPLGGASLLGEGYPAGFLNFKLWNAQNVAFSAKGCFKKQGFFPEAFLRFPIVKGAGVGVNLGKDIASGSFVFSEKEAKGLANFSYFMNSGDDFWNVERRARVLIAGNASGLSFNCGALFFNNEGFGMGQSYNNSQTSFQLKLFKTFSWICSGAGFYFGHALEKQLLKGKVFSSGCFSVKNLKLAAGLTVEDFWHQEKNILQWAAWLGGVKKFGSLACGINFERAYRFPNLSELYWSDAWATGNPHLKAENSWRANLFVELMVKKLKGRVGGSVYLITNGISWAPVDPTDIFSKWTVKNIDKIFKGISFIDLIYSGRKAKFMLSVSFIDALKLEPEYARICRIPWLVGKATGNVELLRIGKASVGLEGWAFLRKFSREDIYQLPFKVEDDQVTSERVDLIAEGGVEAYLSFCSTKFSFGVSDISNTQYAYSDLVPSDRFVVYFEMNSSFHSLK